MENLALAEDYGIPETPHVNIMFDALDDSITQQVSGNESFTLTQAQVYARSVIGSENASFGDRAGNEDFFGTISSGIKSTVDYIVKMFQNLWGFFFKKDAVATIEKAKEDVKKEQAAIQQLASPSNEAEANDSLKSVAEALSKAEGPEAKALHDTVVAAKGMDLAGKKAALAKAVPEMPKLNKKVVWDFETAKKGVAELADKFVNWSDKAVKDLAAMGVTGSHEGVEASKSVIGRVEKFADHSKTGKKVVESVQIHSLSDAKSFLDKINAMLGESESWAKGMREDEGKVQKAVTFMQKLANSKAEGVTAEDTAAVKEVLPYLRAGLNFASTAAQYMKKSVAGYTRMSKETSRIFGV